jgi:hypothetical protein
MPSLLRNFLLGLLFCACCLSIGCGGGSKQPEKPGEGDDAPVMDEIPDTKP